jgi:hypothetical protein
VSAPVPPPSGRPRTKEVGLVCLTVAFVALLIYAPSYLPWLLFALWFLVAM